MPRAKKKASNALTAPATSLGGWFLGLDQSSTDNGIALFDSNSNTVYTADFVCTARAPLTERMRQLYDFLAQLLVDIKVEQAYIEAIHPGNRQAYAVLLKIEGMIELLLHQHQVPCSSISANKTNKQSWPSLLNLEGTKEYMKERLIEKIDLNTTLHETDAVGVLLGSLVRDNLITLELLDNLTIKRLPNLNDYHSINNIISPNKES